MVATMRRLSHLLSSIRRRHRHASPIPSPEEPPSPISTADKSCPDFHTVPGGSGMGLLTKKYPYRPLDRQRGEIRLLCFKSGPFAGEGGSAEEHELLLSCSVRHVSLAQKGSIPRYYAVSYTRGDSVKTGRIFVDGVKVDVPLNAEVALRHLRGHRNDDFVNGGVPDDETLLWLDAVCINQDDTKERSQQLFYMGEIFSQARDVLVWLGDDEDRLGLPAMEAISIVVKQCKKETSDLTELFEKVWAVSTTDVATRHCTAAISSSWDLTALRAFYSSQWFQRFWVLQESIVAQRAVCYRGIHAIPFYDVILAARWLCFGTYGRLLPSDGIDDPHVIGIQNASTMWDLTSTPTIVPRTLSNLLLLSLRFDTTDPRDKVFAMVGMLPYNLLLSTYYHLIPDYSMTVEDVYIRATRSLIIDTQSLFILKIASRLVPPTDQKDDDIDVPSWIPRFDWVYDHTKGSASPIRPTNRPASDVKSILIRAPGLSSVLTVRGVVCDEIAHMAESPWDAFTSHVSTLKARVVSAWEMTQKHAVAEMCGSLRIAYAATICVGRNKAQRDITLDLQSSADCAAFFLACGEPCGGLAKYYQSLANKYKIVPTAESCEDFRAAVAYNTRNLVFFITKDGRLGMCPRTSRVGDKVCIIPGCDVPTIMRKEGVFWRFVGDAYVYGIMDGEYFRKLDYQRRLEKEMIWFNIH